MHKLTKLFNFRPAIICSISIIMGIISAYFYFFNSPFAFIVGIPFLILLVVSFVLRNKEKLKWNIFLSFIFIVIFFISGCLFYVKVDNFNKADYNNHYCTVYGRVKEFSSNDYGKEFILEDVSISGIYSGETNYNVSLYVSGESDLDIGDKVSIYGILYDKGLIYEGKFSATNIENDIKYSMSVTAEEVSYLGNSLSVFQKANLFIRESLKSVLLEDEFTVAYSLLTGNSEYMSLETITSYRNAGVAHIFAVSGLHIGFIAFTILFIFKKIKAKKNISYIITVIAIIFYAGICGFSTSSVRATIMCIVGLFASKSGFRYDGLSAVGVACSIILIISPVSLFCVGFQLSFGVVLSIILLAKPISKLFKFLPNKLADILGSVISAQLAGVPICLYAFGQFSIIAIIANILFIPIVSIVFIITLLGVIIGGAFSITQYILLPIKYILIALNSIITVFDNNVFIISGITIGLFAIPYYSTLIIGSGLINIKKSLKTLFMIALSIICIGGTIGLSTANTNRVKGFVIGSDRISSTIIYSKNENVLIVNNCKKYFPMGRLNRISNYYGIESLDKVFFANGIDDIHIALTRIVSCFDIKEVYIYGQENQTEKQIIEKSFNAKTTYITNDFLINGDNFKYRFLLEGYAVEIFNADYNAIFFSPFGDKYSGYVGLNNNYDLIVAYDYLEGIDNLYNPKKLISYRLSKNYQNGESEGNRIFYIN